MAIILVREKSIIPGPLLIMLPMTVRPALLGTDIRQQHLQHLLSHVDELRIQMMQKLLHGKNIRVTLDDSLVYSEIDKDPALSSISY